MSVKVSQSIVNQKCDLLKSQNEEITVQKIKKLIGHEVCIFDLVEKVALYKENRDGAIKIAQSETIVETPTQSTDELLNIIKNTLSKYSISSSDVALSLRDNINKYISSEDENKHKKLKEKLFSTINKNDSLEISNLTLDKRYKDLLEKYQELKNSNYTLKQNYNSNASKYMQKQKEEENLLDWEDFKSIKEQFGMLSGYAKVAVYDKKGFIAIKFPGTDYLIQECRKGSSKYLKAKTTYDYTSQSWILTEFSDTSKTLDFLRRNKFVFSKELETVAYRSKQE